MASNPSLEFIDQSVVASSGRVRVKAEGRQRARIAVMRDYLHKVRTQQHDVPEPKPSGNLKQHTGRYRLTPSGPKRGRTGSKGGKTPTTIISIDADPKYDFALPYALLGQQVFPIKSPSPETSDTVDYYFHAYWANSAAVNPDFAWTIFTLADQAMVHAKLSLVALHRADRETGALSTEHLYHRGQAIRRVTERLADHTVTATESDIGAIALLATVDNHSQWATATQDSHILAVATLVRAVGGIDSKKIGDPLRRVLGWVDLLHSTLSERKPLLGESVMAIAASNEEIRSAATSDFRQKHLRLNATTRNAKHLHRILRQLSLLADVSMYLQSFPTRKLRLFFSNTLWRLEYDILKLPSMGIGQHPWGEREALQAFRDAALIFSYANLRDQNSIFIFGKLTQRLQGYISPMLEEARNDKEYLRLGEVTILIWVLLMGWRAAVRARIDTRWFSLRVLEMSIRYGLAEKVFADTVSSDGVELLTIGLDGNEIRQIRDEMRQWVSMAKTNLMDSVLVSE